MLSLILRCSRVSLKTLQKTTSCVVVPKCDYNNKFNYQQHQGSEGYFHKSSQGAFSTKDFIYEHTHGETGSLNTRFIKYIALENCKHDPLTPQNIRYSEYFPISDARTFNQLLKKTPTDQLTRLLVFSFTYKSNGDPIKVVQTINEIDQICVERLPEMTHDQILRVLYSFMFLIPSQITKSKFYQEAMTAIVERFDCSFNKHAFVQVSFYLGLWKKNKTSVDLMYSFLQNNLIKYLPELSQTDLAIVCNSAFRTSVVIENQTFLKKLENETLSTKMDEDALLVTFIKSLRLNRFKSQEVYNKLKAELGKFDLDKLHFKGLVHFFAYFADGLYNDKEVCKILLDECMNRLEKLGANSRNLLINDMRAKDITTFLWCITNLSLSESFSEDDLKFLEDIVLSKFANNEYKYRPDELIETCLSLWMLGQRSSSILEEIFKLNFAQFSNNTDRVKLNTRLGLLFSCVEIEDPSMLKRRFGKEKAFNESKPAPEYLLKSEELNRVNEFLEANLEQFGMKSVKLVSPIKDLNIPGILVNFQNENRSGGDKCYLEVLTANKYLQFDSTLTAMVQLKKRLLEKLGYQVILIEPKHYESNEHLRKFLIESLSIEPPAEDRKATSIN